MHLATEICERARLSRDSRFDGQFFVGVRTTGIYCRPICPASGAKSQNAVINLGRAVRDGDVSLDGTADLNTTLERLQGLPGIGEWTATYVAMRVLGDPDAFPCTDLGLRKALRPGELVSATELRKRAESWRPWRGYAAAVLWRSLNQQSGG
jgi:AraC family transcriptional regulator of adaptative response / DNA-3-methyladenine glycosylase II